MACAHTWKYLALVEIHLAQWKYCNRIAWGHLCRGILTSASADMYFSCSTAGILLKLIPGDSPRSCWRPEITAAARAQGDVYTSARAVQDGCTTASPHSTIISCLFVRSPPPVARGLTALSLPSPGPSLIHHSYLSSLLGDAMGRKRKRGQQRDGEGKFYSTGALPHMSFWGETTLRSMGL